MDDRHTLLEMQVSVDLEGYEDPDGINRPYVITINKSDREILVWASMASDWSI